MTEPKQKPSKPTLDDLLNQIYEWREKTWLELRAYERHEDARLMASNLLS